MSPSFGVYALAVVAIVSSNKKGVKTLFIIFSNYCRSEHLNHFSNYRGVWLHQFRADFLN